MVRRGLAATVTEAGLAIREGKVAVAGRPAAKAATMVTDAEPIALAPPPRRFVSRGGEKLEGALERFDVDVTGRQALDAGASTGGFTDCLLARGAAAVVAVDVGYGQLDWRLRTDPRVTIFERTNARDLTRDQLPFAPDVVTADLSFISLASVVPALANSAGPAADFVLLVKPQFESARESVGAGGVVSDPGSWRSAIEGVAKACRSCGLRVRGAMASPLLGPAGNAEFFVWAARPSSDHATAQADPDAAEDTWLEAAVAEAVSLRAARGGGAPDA
jgi:23S rRNA (cytidine1920-2'-O)/16S rRNA (cytidine1409-2'-O)-methyltransferase